MSSLVKSLLLSFTLTTMTIASPAMAHWRDAPRAGYVRIVQYVPMDQVISKARKRSKGRVLSTRLKMRDGREVYVVKILMPGGKVKRVVVDAISGKVIRR